MVSEALHARSLRKLRYRVMRVLQAQAFQVDVVMTNHGHPVYLSVFPIVRVGRRRTVSLLRRDRVNNYKRQHQVGVFPDSFFVNVNDDRGLRAMNHV